jgi:hypothetical protein
MVHEFEELFVRRATMAGDETIPFERDQPYGTKYRHAPVKFTASKTVGLCADGDTPFGSLERVEADGSVVVAWLGSVLYAGAASADAGVVGDGAGKVRDADPDASEVGRGITGSSEGGRVVVFQ